MSKPMINKDMTVSGTSYTLEDLCKKIDSLNTSINAINIKLNRTRTTVSLTVASGVTISHDPVAIKDTLTGVVQLRGLLLKDIVSGWNLICTIPKGYRPVPSYMDYTNVSNANDIGGHIRIQSNGELYFYGNSTFSGANHPVYIDVTYLTDL